MAYDKISEDTSAEREAYGKCLHALLQSARPTAMMGTEYHKKFMESVQKCKTKIDSDKSINLHQIKGEIEKYIETYVRALEQSTNKIFRQDQPKKEQLDLAFSYAKDMKHAIVTAISEINKVQIENNQRKQGLSEKAKNSFNSVIDWFKKQVEKVGKVLQTLSEKMPDLNKQFAKKEVMFGGPKEKKLLAKEGEGLEGPGVASDEYEEPTTRPGKK